MGGLDKGTRRTASPIRTATKARSAYYNDTQSTIGRQISSIQFKTGIVAGDTLPLFVVTDFGLLVRSVLSADLFIEYVFAFFFTAVDGLALQPLAERRVDVARRMVETGRR